MDGCLRHRGKDLLCGPARAENVCSFCSGPSVCIMCVRRLSAITRQRPTTDRDKPTMRQIDAMHRRLVCGTSGIQDVIGPARFLPCCPRHRTDAVCARHRMGLLAHPVGCEPSCCANEAMRFVVLISFQIMSTLTKFFPISFSSILNSPLSPPLLPPSESHQECD